MTGVGGYTLVYDPPMPFSATLAACLTPGRYVRVSGKVPDGANKFKVDLVNCNVGDIAFHFNPRFKDGSIVRNTRVKKKWGAEERQAGCLPFVPGQDFELEIKNEGSSFCVYVNGEKVCSYTHRLPCKDVNMIEIGGDVTLTTVQY